MVSLVEPVEGEMCIGSPAPLRSMLLAIQYRTVPGSSMIIL
jgi:hypothetical protein